jgi:teichuronic acid biosynthesis glycosyltransferase TuaC
MNVLFVCKDKPGFINNIGTFNNELVNSLRKAGINVDVLTIKGGTFAYFKYSFIVRKQILTGKYDLMHAVYALSGFAGMIQRRIPEVVTFIGSDINKKWVRVITRFFLIKNISASIFVSNNLFIKAGKPLNGNIIPFGINLEKFYPVNKSLCRKEMGFDVLKKYILFSSRFDRPEKNSSLAFNAIELTGISNIELVELINIPDNKMNILFNACDIALMTSVNEGSPQFIKEAMACNLPIVTTDVGDVREIIGNTEGCFICSSNPHEIAKNISEALKFNSGNNGRERILSLGLDPVSTSKKIINIYNSVVLK